MRKIITSAAIAAAAAALLGGTGIAAASSHAAAAKTENFQLMSTSGTSNKSSIIAYGAAFTAAGVDVSGAHNTDTVTFPNGSFKLVHKITGGHQHFNQTTCLLTVSETATYTLGNGTGAYAGISGSGKATLSLLGVAARNSKGKCSQSKPPLAFHELINGSGPVTLP
jgi:hypothetical protein